MNDLPIRILESKSTGVSAIQLTEEPFSGIIYSYGKVEFEEDVENFKLKIKFEYEVHDMNGKVLTDKKPFERSEEHTSELQSH